jgi:hypothetical protein
MAKAVPAVKIVVSGKEAALVGKFGIWRARFMTHLLIT